MSATIKEIMLTTTDNPYNPFTHFDDWYSFDVAAGYHTCSYIDRVAYNSSDLSEEDQEAAVDAAIWEILEHNLTGNYKIVYN